MLLSSSTFRNMKFPDDSFETPKLSAPPPCSSPPNQAPNSPSSATAPPSSNNDDPIYDIEHLLKYLTCKEENQCLVKWKGFTSKHNSWIPVDSLIRKPDSKIPPSSPPHPLDHHTKPMLFLLFVLPAFSHLLF